MTTSKTEATKPKTTRRRLTEAEQARIAARHLDARERAERSVYVLSTAILDRGRLFQPTSTPVHIDTYSTPIVVDGVCTTQVAGRLGQTHAALLESIWLRAVRLRTMDDGSAIVTVPRAAVQQDLGTTREYGLKSLNELLLDLQKVRIRLTAFNAGLWGKDGDDVPEVIEGAIIRSCTTVKTKHNGIRLTVTLDPAYLSILRHDQAPSGRNRLAVMHLRHGLSRAVARWLLSQSVTRQPRGGWHLDTVLTSVLGPRRPKELTWDRNKIRKEGVAAWERCGISFTGLSGRQPRVRLLRYDEAATSQDRP